MLSSEMHKKILPGVLSGDVPVAQIGRDATVRAAALAMASSGVDVLAVVGPDGGFAGILTAGDVARRGLGAGADPDRQRVADVMTPNPDTLAPTDSALDAFALMRGRGVGCLAVVDGGKPVGMVTLADLTGALADVLDRAAADAEAGMFTPTR